jgi:hypothetical protein
MTAYVKLRHVNAHGWLTNPRQLIYTSYALIEQLFDMIYIYK